MLDSNSLEIQKNKFKIPITAIFLIALCWVLALINQAYFQGVFEVSEAREGVVVNEIKEYGTWILPLRNGEVIPSKPPLFHWLTAIFSTGFKSLNEFSLRAVSLFTAILSIIFFHLFLKLDLKNKDNISGIPLVSSLIYATTYGFIQMSIDGRVDMTFNLFFLLSVLILNHFLLNDKIPSLKDKILLSLILALGILSRGPLALVLFFLALGAGLVSLGKIKDLKNWIVDNYFVIVIAPLVISGPWYLASKFMGKPELIKRQLVFENITRFFGSDKIPSKPFWFYLENIWMQSFPWGFVLIVLVALLMKSKKSFFSNDKIRRYLVLYGSQALVIFIFFSISSGKRKAYLLSVLPFLAVIIGILYSRISEIYNLSKFKSEKVEKISFLFVVLSLIAIALWCLLSIGVPNFLKFSFFEGLQHLPLFALLLPFSITLCLHYIVKKYKGSPQWLTIVIVCLSLQSYITLPAFFFLTKGESHSYKYFVDEVKGLLGPEVLLKVVKTKDDESLDSFLFYYGKRIPMAPIDGVEESGIYLSKKSWMNSQSLEFKNRTEILVEGSRLADKKRRQLIVFKFD